MTVILIIICIAILIYGFTAFTGAPLVPSHQNHVKDAFTNLYHLSKKDYLVDLGAGSGTILKIASATKAKALGVELSPVFAFIIHLRFLHDKNVKVKCANFYHIEFPKETTVVYLFGDSRNLNKIYQKVESEATRLNKELKLISYAFQIPDHKPSKSTATHHLYIVKPKVQK